MVDETEPTYITQERAAELLGVARRTVTGYVTKGLLESLGPSGPGVGTIDLEQVRTLARERARLRRNLKRRAARAKADRRPHPPDEEHEWLGLVATAELLGVTRSAVSQRCRRGTIPYVEHRGQRWFRRDLLDVWTNARVTQRTRKP